MRTLILAADAVSGLERTVDTDGKVALDGTKHLVGFAYAGRHITLGRDGHAMPAVIDHVLVGDLSLPDSRSGTFHPARCPSGRFLQEH